MIYMQNMLHIYYDVTLVCLDFAEELIYSKEHGRGSKSLILHEVHRNSCLTNAGKMI